MRIALTGGTGFIGSHFLNHALAAGHSVLALRRSLSSTPRIPLLTSPEWLDCQLSEVTSSDLDKCETLVHLAAHSANPPYDSLYACMQYNVLSAIQLFDQAYQAGIKRFIVAGSCYEYGTSGEEFDYIPTCAPLRPTNTYAASKAALSTILIQWAREHKVSLEILRVFHVYGQGELSSRFFPSLQTAAFRGDNFKMTSGDQVRDFMPVSSVAKTFVKRACTAPDEQGLIRVFNLTSGSPRSLWSFASLWWEKWEAKGVLLRSAIPQRTGEIMRYVGGPELLSIESD